MSQTQGKNALSKLALKQLNTGFLCLDGDTKKSPHILYENATPCRKQCSESQHKSAAILPTKEQDQIFSNRFLLIGLATRAITETAKKPLQWLFGLTISLITEVLAAYCSRH